MEAWGNAESESGKTNQSLRDQGQWGRVRLTFSAVASSYTFSYFSNQGGLSATSVVRRTWVLFTRPDFLPFSPVTILVNIVLITAEVGCFSSVITGSRRPLAALTLSFSKYYWVVTVQGDRLCDQRMVGVVAGHGKGRAVSCPDRINDRGRTTFAPVCHNLIWKSPASNNLLFKFWLGIFVNFLCFLCFLPSVLLLPHFTSYLLSTVDSW